MTVDGFVVQAVLRTVSIMPGMENFAPERTGDKQRIPGSQLATHFFFNDLAKCDGHFSIGLGGLAVVQADAVRFGSN